MRPFSLVFGVLSLSVGLFFTYELLVVNAQVSSVPLAGGLASQGLLGVMFLIVAPLFLGLAFTARGLTTAPTKLSVREIKELGLTGDNVRGAAKDVAQATAGVGLTFCPHCGAKISHIGEAFCGSCGFKLT